MSTNEVPDYDYAALIEAFKELRIKLGNPEPALVIVVVAGVARMVNHGTNDTAMSLAQGALEVFSARLAQEVANAPN
jgi:hypothetical protein